MIEKLSDGGFKFVREFLAVFGEVSGELMAFEILPEPFDGIEVRTVGRKKFHFDMVPV